MIFMWHFADQPVVTKLRKLRVNAGDFEQKKVIGRGHFGEVHLVKEKHTGDVYAMKVMKKADTLDRQNVNCLLKYVFFLCQHLRVFHNFALNR